MDGPPKTIPSSVSYPAPPARRLRVYAFDPHASTQLETAGFNVATIELPWEAEGEELRPGPVNEYFEVIDVDPVSGQFYEPVDLNDPRLLAQDGLAPSEGDPRFHQQMVFAVAMKTIRAFERALGRMILWSPRDYREGGRYCEEQIFKLRVYPHALREPNAYYSPQKKALLFGYFKNSDQDAGASWIFTALSHDIIVHETTHAILDGLHRRYAEPTSEDSLAFHEAFADIVALLSHFTLPEAVGRAIAANGGRLDGSTLLSGLARQFGLATGRAGPLRDAIDTQEDDGLEDMLLRRFEIDEPALASALAKMIRKTGGARSQLRPDPERLAEAAEPHERGSVLVSAVFEAFVTIYQRRTEDLLRIADVRLERDVKHDLHPELVARLTREAVKSADHVMRMCIRALDYLPPVDVRFGEFLRAVVTADADLIPADPYGYRLAMIEAFRRRGIVPKGCLSLSVDSLLWERPDHVLSLNELQLSLEPKFVRKEAADQAETNRAKTQIWLLKTDGKEVDRRWQDACGVIFNAALSEQEIPKTITRRPVPGSKKKGEDFPLVEVHSVRMTRRAGPDGQDVRQLIVEVTQRRRGFYEPEMQAAEDRGDTDPPRWHDFVFRGGATLIFDLRTKRLRYVVRKTITSEERLAEQRRFLWSRAAGAGMAATYEQRSGADREPFAIVHRGV